MTGATTEMMRSEAVRVLTEFSQTTKAQQAFLTSCGDATWVSAEQRHTIRWLLSALIEHRRRIRVTARLWRTLTVDEPVARALASATTDLLDENRSFTPLIARWREVVVEQTRIERNEFWRSMIELAEQNMTDSL